VDSSGNSYNYLPKKMKGFYVCCLFVLFLACLSVDARVYARERSLEDSKVLELLLKKFAKPEERESEPFIPPPPPPCIMCSKILKPVCGSDGNFYANKCEMNREACETKTDISIVNEDNCS